jgi:DNA-binding HxlR family transcriptional regulator/putative sterol carrier protein
MAGKRSYGDACGIARALDLVGERWALMVVRELLLGPKRFTDIRAGLPHVSPDVLAQRLRDLEQGGIVDRRRLSPPYCSQVYELTPRGAALETVLIELGRWGGANAPPPSDDMCMSLDAHLVSLRTLFDPRRAGDFTARIELRLGDERFRVAIADGEIEAGRGELPDADAMIETDPTTLIEVLHGHRPLAEALAAGTMRLSGDRRLARRFTQLFPLPARAVV